MVSRANLDEKVQCNNWTEAGVIRNVVKAYWYL
jgi:hypothetical protein